MSALPNQIDRLDKNKYIKRIVWNSKCVFVVLKIHASLNVAQQIAEGAVPELGLPFMQEIQPAYTNKLIEWTQKICLFR